jgi:hypothetical protein
MSDVTCLTGGGQGGYSMPTYKSRGLGVYGLHVKNIALLENNFSSFLLKTGFGGLFFYKLS